MYDKHFVGADLLSFENNGKQGPISRVSIAIDDDTYLTAGDDTGIEITAKCPYATQEMVNAMLATLQGHQYQRLKADGANINPAAEPGDGITAGGVYSVLSVLEDDGTGYSNATAPGEPDTEEEFPAPGPLESSFNRQLTNARASITKNAAEIELRVELDKVISSINLSPEEITIQAERLSLEGLVTINGTFQIDKQGYLRCNGGTIGGFTITGSSLYNGMDSYASTDNGVYIGTNGIALGGGKFKVDSAGNLSASSGTFTGNVYANMIQVGGNAGYITGGQVGSNTISGGNIGSGTVTGWNIGSGTITGGNIGGDTVARGNLVEKYATSAQYNSLAADVAEFQRITTGLATASHIVTTRLTVGSYNAGWQSITVDGRSYNVLTGQ